MVDIEKTGAFISKRRRSLGYTQGRLANELHVTHQAVSKWENGASLPDTGILPDLAKILRVSVDEILSGERKKTGQSSPIGKKKLLPFVSGVIVLSAIVVGAVFGIRLFDRRSAEGRFLAVNYATTAEYYSTIRASKVKVPRVPSFRFASDRVDQHVVYFDFYDVADVILQHYSAGILKRSDHYKYDQITHYSLYKYDKGELSWIFRINANKEVESVWHIAAREDDTAAMIEYTKDGIPTGYFVRRAIPYGDFIEQVEYFQAQRRRTTIVQYHGEQPGSSPGRDSWAYIVSGNGQMMYQMREQQNGMSPAIYIATTGKLDFAFSAPTDSPDSILMKSYFLIFDTDTQNRIGRWDYLRNVKLPENEELPAYIASISEPGYFDSDE